MNLKKNGALITVLLIVFIDILGFTIMIPLLPFYAESLGASPFTVGMISSIYGLCSLIAGPILGDLSDIYGRRIVLLLSQIGSCVGFIILALSHKLWLIFLSRFIDGITSGNITVAQAYISDVTDKENRTRAMSLIGAAFGLGFILGPAISGLLVHFGHAAPIWASVFLSFMSIVGTYTFLIDPPRKSQAVKHESGTLKRMKKSLLLFNSPILKDYFIAFFIFSICFSLYMSGLAMFCERALIWKGKPFATREVGLLLSYVGIVSLSLQIFSMDYLLRTFGEMKIMLIGFASTALAFFMMGIAPLLSIFLVGITINTFGNAILRPAISGMLSKNADPSQQGLVFGLNQTLMSFAQVICPLISGFLIEKNWTFFWCLLIATISFMGLLIGKTASNQKRASYT